MNLPPDQRPLDRPDYGYILLGTIWVLGFVLGFAAATALAVLYFTN